MNDTPTNRAQQLIAQWLDDAAAMSAQERDELELLLQSDPSLLREMVDHLLLDSLLAEQLGNESLASLVDWVAVSPGEAECAVAKSTASAPTRNSNSARRRLGWMTALAVVLLIGSVAVSGKFFFENRVSASAIELRRIIAASSLQNDRTYQITVEEVAELPRGARGKRSREAERPPKPPLDDAVLHVRGGRQFVLTRKTTSGGMFVTGSNGRTSWAVAPDGPVRVSADLDRFNHDLPGHEHHLPLVNLEEGFAQLQAAYDLRVLPIEPTDGQSNGLSDDTPVEPSRLLVALRKRGFRGPNRVEITYAAESGQIRQLRFVEMPYGPERLTIRLTLVDQQPQAAEFFDHESHHAAARAVITEE